MGGRRQRRPPAGRAQRAQPGIEGPDALGARPHRPRGHWSPPSRPRATPAPAPGASRHETGPSTTFGRHPPTMASRAKIKPQVDGLRFLRNTGYGRGVGLKRSRWAGFVAAASRAADRGRPEVSKEPV